MASETFKKRQKESALKEKQKEKLARRLERKNDKAEGASGLDGKNVQIAPPRGQRGPTIL